MRYTFEQIDRSLKNHGFKHEDSCPSNINPCHDHYYERSNGRGGIQYAVINVFKYASDGVPKCQIDYMCPKEWGETILKDLNKELVKGIK